MFPGSEFFTSFRLEQLHHASAWLVHPLELVIAIPVQIEKAVKLSNEIGKSGDRNHQQNIP